LSPWAAVGRYGPFYRTGTAQSDEVTRRQLESGELWGRHDRGSDRLSVDAWVGALPPGRAGVEFFTDVEPSPGSPPGKARWLGPRDGVEVDGEWAKISGTISGTRFRSP